MGILKNYANSTAVEAALDKGVQGYDKAVKNETDISSIKEDLNVLEAKTVLTKSTNWLSSSGAGTLTLHQIGNSGNLYALSFGGGGAPTSMTDDFLLCTVEGLRPSFTQVLPTVIMTSQTSEASGLRRMIPTHTTFGTDGRIIIRLPKGETITDASSFEISGMIMLKPVKTN